MCTLNYTPMYYVWMFRRLQDSGPKLGRVQQRPGWFMLIYSRFTWTLKTVNTRIRNTKHYSTTCIVTNIDCLDNKWQITWKTIANNLCDYTITDQWNEWEKKHKSYDTWVLGTATAPIYQIISPDNDMMFLRWKLSIKVKNTRNIASTWISG